MLAGASNSGTMKVARNRRGIGETSQLKTAGNFSKDRSGPIQEQVWHCLTQAQEQVWCLNECDQVCQNVEQNTWTENKQWGRTMTANYFTVNFGGKGNVRSKKDSADTSNPTLINIFVTNK